MIRAALRIAAAITGCAVLVILAAAVRHDPHLWGQLLTSLDHQARARGNSIDGQVTRIVTPATGATP